MSARETRYLIVNADDFGQSHGINRGVIEAHERGIVTSASLMVRWPATVDAAAYAREHAELSLGLHVDLGEWAYHDSAWVAVYGVAPTDDRRALADEVGRQIESFRRLVGADPTHIDSHQHVHRHEPLRSLLAAHAAQFRVPLRHFTPAVQYRGDFYGQTGKGEPYPEAISSAALLAVIATLPPGVTELGCHPGFAEDLTSMYTEERAEEVKVLCEPVLRRVLAAKGVALCSFRDVPGLG